MIIRTIEALFTLKTNTIDFRKATSQVDRFAQNANNVLGAIAGHFVFRAITGFVTESAKAMSEVGKSAGLLGLATNALQEMRYAAEKSGVSIDTLDDSLKELQIRAVDSLSGSGEAFDAFNKLKVNPKDALGRIREPLELLDEVADKLRQLPTQSERIWVVDSMFGDQGAMMLKMLKGGSQGLREMRIEARSLGHVLSSEAINKAERFNESLRRMKAAFGGLVNTLINGIVPGLTKAMEGWANLSIHMQSSDTTSKLLRLGVIALGEALVFLAIKAGLALVAINPLSAAAAAGVVALTFAVEDLWSASKGEPSFFKGLRDWGKTFDAYLIEKMTEFGQFLINAVPNQIKITTGLWRLEIEMFFNWLGQKIGQIGTYLLGGLADKFKTAHKQLTDLMPDSFKIGLAATMKIHDSSQINSRMGGSISPHNRFSSNHSVNVAVNVKSGADPQQIGGEVSKAVRKELERERFNAFMGVSQYAN